MGVTRLFNTFLFGAAVGAGLLLVGALLQLTLGPIDWQLLSSPYNVVVFTLFVVTLCVCYAFRHRLLIVSWAMTQYAAVPALIYGVAVTLVMGLTGWDTMLSAWSFVLIYVWLLAIVGLVAIDRIVRLVSGCPVKQSRLVTFSSILNHAGLFIALACGTLGNADLQRLQMTVHEGHPESYAINPDKHGLVSQLPFAIQLNNFTIDEYAPQYFIVDNETGETLSDSPWQLKQDTLLQFAVPRQTDYGYEENHDTGACTAAYVSATRNDSASIKGGWVTCGSYLFPFQALQLDDRCSVVMADPEPKRFASEITVITSDRREVNAIIEVNHPFEVEGWKIYQLSYNISLGRWSDVSVLELVRDPWLPWVYTGIFMLLAGAVMMFFSKGAKH